MTITQVAPIYQSLVVAYAKAVYLNGTKTLPQIRVEYVELVKQYAAETFSSTEIENALVKGWITLQEYNDTTAITFSQQ